MLLRVQEGGRFELEEAALSAHSVAVKLTNIGFPSNS